jgi:hypothetical protein
VESGFLCTVYWIYRQAEFTITYYSRNLINSSPADTLYSSAAIIHFVLIHCIVLHWPTSQLSLLVLHSYSTRTAPPSVSPINVGIRHAENAAPCTVARDVTEVTWSFLTVAPFSVTRNLATHGAARSEGKQDAAALRYCCKNALLEVSEFQQLPHGAITPQYELERGWEREIHESLSYDRFTALYFNNLKMQHREDTL